MSCYGSYIIKESYDSIVDKLRNVLNELNKIKLEIESEKDLKKRIKLVEKEIKLIEETIALVKKDKIDFTDLFKSHKRGPIHDIGSLEYTHDKDGNLELKESEYKPKKVLIEAIMTVALGTCSVLLLSKGKIGTSIGLGLGSYIVGYSTVQELYDLIFKKKKVSEQLTEIIKNLKEINNAYTKCIEKGYKTSDDLKKVGLNHSNIKDINNTNYMDIWNNISKKMLIKKSTDDFSNVVVYNSSKGAPYCTKGIDMILPDLKKFIELSKNEIESIYDTKSFTYTIERNNRMNNDVDSIVVEWDSGKCDNSKEINNIFNKLFKKYMETVYPNPKYFNYQFDIDYMWITFKDTTGFQV